MNEYINLTLENIDEEHICCAIGDKKHQAGVDSKKEWIKSKLKDGHIFRKLNTRGKIFIEYEPIETAWIPISGKNYEYIYCLWVAGSFKGKGMPDSSIMLDLCNELKISVNELLCGELIEMNNYNEVAEKTLLEMAQKEEMQNKKLMMYENVIGFSSAISFLILIFVTSFLAENNIAKIVLFILAFILLIIGVSFALKIETETGYYECQKCHYKYVPKYSQVYFAMHSGTTRYMKCPKCNKKSWQRKILSKK